MFQHISLLHQHMHIIFLFDTYISICQVCCSSCRINSLKNIQFKLTGSNVTIQGICSMCDERYSWDSQPKLGLKFAGNVLIPAGIVLA